MSFSGSGTFLINTAGQPVVSGTVISSTAFNALTADLATGLSTCITKDGQTTVTANIPMANYKFTGLGAGSAAADSANLSQVQSTVVKLLASVSGTDTITAVGSPTVAAYAAGQMFYFVAAGDNTGAVTINIDSLGAKAVTRDGSVALAAGDIKSGEVVVIVYDGTRFQVVSQLNSSGDARFANVSIASSLYVGGVATIVGNAGFSANVSIASALSVGGVATVTGGATLNGGVVINEPGADVDFRVEGDTDANLIFADASTDRVGMGIATPAEKLHLFGSSSATSPRILVQSHDTANATAGITFYGRDASNVNFISGFATSGSALTFLTNNTLQATLSSSGNLGLGVTPSAWNGSSKAFQYGTNSALENYTGLNSQYLYNAFRNSSNAYTYITNNYALAYSQNSSGEHAWFTAPSGTAGNAITFTQAMTLDASGNLGIGTTSPAPTRLKVSTAEAKTSAANSVFVLGTSTGGTSDLELSFYRSASGSGAYYGLQSVEQNVAYRDLVLQRDGGNVLVGKTSANGTVVGGEIRTTGIGVFTTSGNYCVYANRKASDGVLVELAQDDTTEGTISVSGNTVSYNAFAGSHWSQLHDGSKPDILRGTVMESINELCVWPGEQNERLPKSKVSDTAGSKKVYGVFMAWDNDWTTTNDMYVTAVGAFICRVNGSVTVQEGDLLESNGDGTARVQADDIIRSSTIGKVTSTVKTHEYDDGSYCVPTVLYCG